MTRLSDIEGRQPHRWLTSAINHLGRDADDCTVQAIAIMLAHKAQVQPVDISAALGKVTR